MSNKPTRPSPEWHAEAAGTLKATFAGIHAAFLDAAEKAVRLGMYLNYIKERGKADKSIPHGQFGPWLKTNVPEISRSQIAMYMTIGKGVLDQAKLSFSKFRKSEFCLDGKLPPGVQKLIEGKNQQALFLEFKQAEEIEDGVLSPKRGRRKGEGGNSAEHLAALRAAEEKARVEAVELDVEETIKLIEKHCDAKGYGCCQEALLKKLHDAFTLGKSCTGSLLGGRTSAKKS